MQNQENDKTQRYYVKNREKTTKDFFVCRSSWEYKFFQGLDCTGSVLKWIAEPFAIPYYDPLSNKERRYYPDALVKVKTKNDEEKVFLIEIKPMKECEIPKTGKKTKKTQLHEKRTWIINKNKWLAANSYCRKKGGTFKVITEKELFAN